MKKPRFIVLEGADGSGKSTHSRLLADYLNSRGISALVTAEPTKGQIGQKIRMVLKGSEHASAEELTQLFTEDRKEHVDMLIIPALDSGKTVICDRFYYSTIAYQSVQGVDEGWISELNSFVPEPDIVILLEIDPEEADTRISGREREVFEYIDFQRKVQAKLLEMASGASERLSVPGKKWVIVKNEGTTEEVQNKIRDAVEPLD
jgi:dTMP kinase